MATSGFSQSCKRKYKDKLEANSRLKSCGENFTVEKLEDGRYVVKTYYPENKTITHLVTYKSKRFQIRHGLFQNRWDDGTLTNSGIYENNEKEGKWIENTYETGFYERGLKQGEWEIYHHSDSTLSRKESYLNGELHGNLTVFDTLGNIEYRKVYEFGELISSTRQDTTVILNEELPRFPGCEDLGLEPEEFIKCSDKKLVEYLSANIKYPRYSREAGIEGQAIVQFVINKDGQVTDIKVLNGVSRDIKQEVIRLVSEMPKWKPGMQDGNPVKVLFTLPLRFNLE